MTERVDRHAARTLVADVDTGIDDALALLWLAGRHRAGEIDLHVTTSAGNTTATRAARNSVETLRLAGVPEVPVTAGASRPRVLPLTTTPETHGPEGLGYHIPAEGTVPAGFSAASGDRSTASDAVAAWAAASPDLILVAGPATNLAWAVEHRPELLVGTRTALMCGAFLHPGNTTPTAEWNAWSDPHALAYCLDNWPAGAPRPLICPLNVTEQVVLTPRQLAEWLTVLTGTTADRGDRADGTGGETAGTSADVEAVASPAPVGPEAPVDSTEIAVFLDEILRFYMEFHASVGVGYVAQIHDLAAAMVLCGAVRAELRDATVRVEVESDLLRGTTVADWTGATAQGDGREGGGGSGDAGDSAGADQSGEPTCGPYWGRPANARVLTGLDPGEVFARFGENLAVVKQQVLS